MRYLALDLGSSWTKTALLEDGNMLQERSVPTRCQRIPRGCALKSMRKRTSGRYRQSWNTIFPRNPRIAPFNANARLCIDRCSFPASYALYLLAGWNGAKSPGRYMHPCGEGRYCSFRCTTERKFGTLRAAVPPHVWCALPVRARFLIRWEDTWIAA